MSWEQCPHTKDNGDQCGMTANLNSKTGLCVWHDPEREETAHRMRSKGGRSTAKSGTVLPAEAPPAPTSVEGAARMLSWLSGAVLGGDVDRHTARDVGYLLRAFVDAAEVDVEERLEQVEGEQQTLREQLEAVKRRSDMRAS